MKNKIVMLTGIKGTGKSYLLRKMVIPKLTGIKPVIIIDPADDHHNGYIFSDADSLVKAGFKLIEDYRKFNEFPILIFKPKSLDYSEDADIIFSSIFDKGIKCSLVVDESGVIMSSSYISRELKRLVALGRHKSIDQVYVAQRPTMINPLVRAQADYFISFRQQYIRDLVALAEYGFDKEKLSELPNHKFLTVSNGKTVDFGTIFD